MKRVTPTTGQDHWLVRIDHVRAWLARLVTAAMVAALAGVALGASAATAADIGSQLTLVTAQLTGPTNPAQDSAERYDLTIQATVPDSAVADDSWQLTIPTQVNKWSPPLTLAYPQDPNDAWVTITIIDGVATFALTASGAAQQNLVVNAEFGGTLAYGLGQGSTPSTRPTRRTLRSRRRRPSRARRRRRASPLRWSSPASWR